MNQAVIQTGLVDQSLRCHKDVLSPYLGLNRIGLIRTDGYVRDLCCEPVRHRLCGWSLYAEELQVTMA